MKYCSPSNESVAWGLVCSAILLSGCQDTDGIITERQWGTASTWSQLNAENPQPSVDWADLKLPAPELHHGELGLRALAERQRQVERSFGDWRGDYQDAIDAFFKQLELETTST